MYYNLICIFICSTIWTKKFILVKSGCYTAGGLRVGQCGWTGPAGPDPKGDSNGNLIFEFQGFLEFGKTLRNSTRRFKRNLGMGIFPKFF
jgi:hypothetical protein